MVNTYHYISLQIVTNTFQILPFLLTLPTSTLVNFKIKINVTNNRHFAFVYLLGKLDYSLYGQQNKNRLCINNFRIRPLGDLISLASLVWI